MTNITIALAGAPNAGKSTLFNRLTGSNQKIGNYPGVTVEKKTGHFLSPAGVLIEVIDLPGTYSLEAQSDDERVAVESLFREGNQALSLVVVVADATNLERSLGLVLDLKKLGYPVIVSLNMMDLALKRGLKVDLRKLEKRLGFPAIPTIALKKGGIQDLLVAIDALIQKSSTNEFVQQKTAAEAQIDPTVVGQENKIPSENREDPGMARAAVLGEKGTQGFDQASPAREGAAKSFEGFRLDSKTGVQKSVYFEYSPESLKQRSDEVDAILAEAVLERTRADAVTDQIDKVLLHPVFGVVILISILFFMFESVFSWAAYPMDLIEQGVAALGVAIGEFLPAGAIQDLVVNGVIGGVGSVLVFLPQILIMFTFILLLEGSGYMARVAFLLNRLMAAVGLQRQAAVPLLSSFACAIPGIMATRTIKSPRERIITMMVAPLMTCSARLPVYVLLVGAFIPASISVGPFGLQGLVMFGLFLSAVLFAMIVAFVLKKFAVKGKSAPFVMELPTYKVPSLVHLLVSLRLRARAFLKRAGTTILAISVILWFLSSYPKAPQGAEREAIHYSFAGQLGHAIEPLVAPVGFDWRIAVGLVPGFAAREVMVSSLGTVFAIENAEDDNMGTLQDALKETWALPTALALLVWYIFAPQCLATFAVLRRESNSWKWTLLTFAYMLLLAYLGAWITFRIAMAA